MKCLKLVLILGLSLCFLRCSDDSTSPAEEPLGTTHIGAAAQSLAGFETVIERIRTDLKIPGLSAAIAKNGKIVWAKGFGLASRERNIPATPRTVYHLASLTKPFAAVIVMQLVESGRVNLDAPVSDFGISLSSPGVIRVRHLLSHTSEGVPGSVYSYNGNRYGLLDSVISRTTGKSFCAMLEQNIINPLNLTGTSPNPYSPGACVQSQAIKNALAQGYSPNGQHPQLYPSYFGSAAGIVSTVVDVALFSLALDTDTLLKAATRQRMFAPTLANDGTILPYALGWFVDRSETVPVLWHYGYWEAISSLIIKIPERGLTFVILANTDRLSSASAGIGSDQNVNCSVAGQEFLNAFVYGSAQLPDTSIVL